MKSGFGPLLVGLGSFLWATDALVRVPAIAKSDPSFIVFVEHLVGVIALLPVFWFGSRRNLFRLGSWKNWLACAFVGAGGSALALLFFTQAFQFLNPNLNILLQKTQPIAVVLIAFLFLKEKPGENFYTWAGVSIFSCMVLNFFDAETPGVDHNSNLAKGIAYSLSASLIWALSTVTGKKLLDQVDPLVATFWRFVFGLITLIFLLAFGSGFSAMHTLFEPEYRLTYLYLGIFPGVLAMWTYYRGMKATTAITTTIVELIFPVGSIVLNYFFLGSTLTPLQMVFSVVLLLSVTQISMIDAKRAAGPEQPA
ncbi:MAG: DMT family transporter [Planctomycetaceae bacterium]